MNGWMRCYHPWCSPSSHTIAWQPVSQNIKSGIPDSCLPCVTNEHDRVLLTGFPCILSKVLVWIFTGH